MDETEDTTIIGNSTEINQIIKQITRRIQLAKQTDDTWIQELRDRFVHADALGELLSDIKRYQVYANQADVNGLTANTLVPTIPFEQFTTETLQNEIDTMVDPLSYTGLITTTNITLFDFDDPPTLVIQTGLNQYTTSITQIDNRLMAMCTIQNGVETKMLMLNFNDSYYIHAIIESPRNIKTGTDKVGQDVGSLFKTEILDHPIEIEMISVVILFELKLNLGMTSKYEDVRLSIVGMLERTHTLNNYPEFRNDVMTHGTLYDNVEYHMHRREHELQQSDINFAQHFNFYVTGVITATGYAYQSYALLALSDTSQLKLNEVSKYPSDEIVTTLADVMAQISELSRSVTRFVPYSLDYEFDRPGCAYITRKYYSWPAGSIGTSPGSDSNLIKFLGYLPEKSEFDMHPSTANVVNTPMSYKFYEDDEIIQYVDLVINQTVDTAKNPYFVENKTLEQPHKISGYTLNSTGNWNQIQYIDITASSSVLRTLGFAIVGGAVRVTITIVGIQILWKRAYGELIDIEVDANYACQFVDKMAILDVIAIESVRTTVDEYGTLYGVNLVMDETLTWNDTIDDTSYYLDDLVKSSDARMRFTTEDTQSPRFTADGYFDASYGKVLCSGTICDTCSTGAQRIMYAIVELNDQTHRERVWGSASKYTHSTRVSKTAVNIRSELSALTQVRHGNVSACLHSIWIGGKIHIKARVPHAPGEMSIRKDYDRSANSLDFVIEVLRSDVDTLKNQVDYLLKAVEELELLVNQLITAMNPGPWETLLNETTNLIYGGLIPLGTVLAVKGVSALIARSTVVAKNMMRNTMAVSQSFSKVLGSRRNTKLNASGVSESEFMINAVELAINQSVAHVRRKERPRYEKSREALERIDTAELLDFHLGMKLGGRTYENDTKLTDVVRSRNRNINDVQMPTIDIRTRPLEILGPLKNVANRVYGNTESARRAAVQASGVGGTRRLYHSYAVTNQYYQHEGELRKRKIQFGIAEPGFKTVTGDLSGKDGAGGIGGIIVDYRQVGMTSDGTHIFAPLKHNEMGFSDDDVNRFYQSVFKKDPLKLTTQRQWNEIVSLLDTHVPNSRSLAEFHIPDPTRLHGIERMVMDPAAWRYRLLTDNCQLFMKEIVNYINTGASSRGFNDVQSIVHQIRVKYIKDVITDISSLIPSYLLALIYKRLRNPNVYTIRRIQPS